MTTKWAIYGPQTNRLSGRIFLHNLGNSPIVHCTLYICLSDPNVGRVVKP